MAATALVHEAEPNWQTRPQSQMVRIKSKARQSNRNGLTHAAWSGGLLGSARGWRRKCSERNGFLPKRAGLSGCGDG
jgi:hypothetical protein